MMISMVFAALLCGCPADPDPEADSGSTPDLAVQDMATATPDTATGDAAETPDVGAITCYEGWSGQSDCCLDTPVLVTAATCPAGSFTAAECGRLDPVCESIDFGTPDDLVAEVEMAVNGARGAQQDCGARGMLGPVGAVSFHPQLVTASQTHADDMAAMDSITFTGSDGSNTGDRTAAAGYPGNMVNESIGSGFADVAEALTAWLAGPDTCANLMDAQMQDLGAGRATAAGGTAYWSVVLGAP